MLWPIIYISVLVVSLVILFLIDPEYCEEPALIVFMFAWPIFFPYVIIVTTCYWVARAIRWICYDLWGCFK